MDQPTSPKPSRGWTPLLSLTVLTLAIFIGVYVGAYYALVSPRFVIRFGGNILSAQSVRFTGPTVPLASPIEASPEYRTILGAQPDWFFTPMHALDRRLRPGVWRVTALPRMP